MKPLLAALAFVAAVPPLAASAAQSRPAALPPASAIAFVSVQKILTESAPARAANQQLDALRKSKQDEVNAKKKTLDETKLALANAGGVFSGSKRAELQKIEQRQEAELKQATEDAQKAFVELQHKLQTDIRNELGRIMNEIARERSLQYVLNADTSLVWARNATDLTPEILERLNATAAANAPAK